MSSGFMLPNVETPSRTAVSGLNSCMQAQETKLSGFITTKMGKSSGILSRNTAGKRQNVSSGFTLTYVKSTSITSVSGLKSSSLS